MFETEATFGLFLLTWNFSVMCWVQCKLLDKQKLLFRLICIIFGTSHVRQYKKTAEWQFCPHWVVVKTNWCDEKITCPSPLGLDFILVPIANRENVYRDLHVICVCRGDSFLKPQGMCCWSSEKHSYVILLMVRRVRMVAGTVLGRKFEPISTWLER